jgi:Protein of unknown function (DUF2510)
MSGWYRDPAGRYELRFHNGEVWTADVASGGQRFVDRLPIEPPRPRGNGLAVAAMVCGISGLTIAWIPFIGLIGMASSVVAVVLGIVARRRAGRRRTEVPTGSDRRGFAITGLITGSLGIVAGALGIWLSVVFIQLIDEYQNPGPLDADLAPCVADAAGLITVDGTLTNLSDAERSYSVRIEVVGGRGQRLERVDVDDVPPGESRRFSTTSRVTSGSEASCRIVSVDGPLPFGIDLDQTD